MANVVVVGSQWGDEGKGKLVDWLCERAEIVVRFQGGHNAGHTLVIDGQSYKLSIIPSGVVRSGKIAVIGNGVVVDPWALLSEVALLRSQGIEITTENLKIAENATLILPLHRELDIAREDSKKTLNIGTTRRGIGPAYEDKVGRRAIRICDLRDLAALDKQIHALLSHHNALRTGFGWDPIDHQGVRDLLADIAPQLLPYACPVWQLLDRAVDSGRAILFEGAQGAMLDVDHGTYPFVTSTNTLAGHAAVGSGIRPSAISYILGITKSYTTRVGAGPFPSELTNHVGQLLGERGFEFGTVTGRARRCGWFDAVVVRQAVKVSGITGLALTKLDVLDDFSEVNICTSYKLGDRSIDCLPTSREDQQTVEPVYETLKGWQKSLRGMRRWDDLPAEAQTYVRRIESLIGVPVSLISTSPERDDTILLRDPFAV